MQSKLELIYNISKNIDDEIVRSTAEENDLASQHQSGCILLAVATSGFQIPSWYPRALQDCVVVLLSCSFF